MIKIFSQTAMTAKMNSCTVNFPNIIIVCYQIISSKYWMANGLKMEGQSLTFAQ